MAFRHLAEGQQGYGSRIGFRFLSGRMTSLPYTHLVETVFDPDSGIVLEFVGRRVVISGRNLVGLYHAIEDETVGEVTEQHANDMAVPESEPYISRIQWDAA